MTGNNDSVTFFKKILVTTTGGVNFLSFPYVKGFSDLIRKPEMSKNVQFLAVLGPIVFMEMLGQPA
jgi:hypothetical protein